MPRVDKRQSEILVQGGNGVSRNSEKALHRRGLLQQSEQLKERETSTITFAEEPSKQLEPVRPAFPIEFLLHFTKQLLLLHPSRDVTYLALKTAISKCPGITKTQIKDFHRAVLNILDESAFPKGFF